MNIVAGLWGPRCGRIKKNPIPICSCDVHEYSVSPITFVILVEVSLIAKFWFLLLASTVRPLPVD